MNQESNSLPRARSNQRIWLIAALIVLCALLICGACVVIAALSFLVPIRGNIVPEGTVPPPEAQPVASEVIPALDPRAAPLFGSVSLQRGFTPDPHTVAVEAAGEVDTSALDLDCGFTTSAPTFAFSLSGGASETFLRLFYVASDETDTTLLVLTPQEEWLCADDSDYGMDPLVDLEFAPSGEYFIWVGTQQEGGRSAGNLSITQSAENTP